MGDVALSLPVIRAVLNKNPEIEINLLTNPRFGAIFKNIPRLNILSFNVFENYKGFFGLWRLFKELKKLNFSLIIDLHQSLRSRILLLYFKLYGFKTNFIDKGREEKQKLIGNIFSNTKILKHITKRYEEVFERAEIKLNLSNKNYSEHGIHHSDKTVQKIDEFLLQNKLKDKTLIGIAPFAKHAVKEWPFEKIQQLINEITQNTQKIIFLFGHGSSEISKLKSLLATQNTSILLCSEHFNLEEELALMSQLNAMLCMDSANMHLAELCGCNKVISIWGPTHPNLGFAPFFNLTENIIQIPVQELTCRPCSVYGNRPCHRGDHACMNRISVETVLNKMK